MSRLQLAVVGTGHLGKIHARLAAASDVIDLKAIVEPDETTRHKIAEEYQTTPLANCRELFGMVDAAIVASPTTTHADVVTELLRGGIHVLVEKPITKTVDEADSLVNLARQQQLVLQVGHVERFNPAFTAVKDKLQDPKFIEARRLSGYTFRSTDVGVVLDLMIHDLDAILNLVQSPIEEVQALGVSVMGHHEDVVNARLRFASGCIANVTASRVSYENQRAMQVFTPHACATIDFGNRQATLVEPDQTILQRSFELNTLSGEDRDNYRDNLFTSLLNKQEVAPEEVNAIEQEQLDFAQAISTSSEPQVTGRDGRDALAVAHKILNQVEAHQWDGHGGFRQGPLAMPESPHVLSVPEQWEIDDTVILPRRKAG